MDESVGYYVPYASVIHAPYNTKNVVLLITHDNIIGKLVNALHDSYSTGGKP